MAEGTYVVGMVGVMVGTAEAAGECRFVLTNHAAEEAGQVVVVVTGYSERQAPAVAALRKCHRSFGPSHLPLLRLDARSC